MIMDDRAQAIIALGMCATVAITVVSIATAYMRTIELRRKGPGRELDPNVQERMSRIEQAVDAIAIEVERMSEGQRFTTRLLAERFGDRAGGDVGATSVRRPGGGGNGIGDGHAR